MTTTRCGIRKNAIIRVVVVKENDHNALWHSKKMPLYASWLLKKMTHTQVPNL
jgi:hypothetical protein